MEGGPCVIDLWAACRVSVHLIVDRLATCIVYHRRTRVECHAFTRGVTRYRSAMLAVSPVSATSNQILMS